MSAIETTTSDGLHEMRSTCNCSQCPHEGEHILTFKCRGDCYMHGPFPTSWKFQAGEYSWNGPIPKQKWKRFIAPGKEEIAFTSILGPPEDPTLTTE